MLFDAIWHWPAAFSKMLQILSSSASDDFAMGAVGARVISRQRII